MQGGPLGLLQGCSPAGLGVQRCSARTQSSWLMVARSERRCWCWSLATCLQADGSVAILGDCEGVRPKGPELLHKAWLSAHRQLLSLQARSTSQLWPLRLHSPVLTKCTFHPSDSLATEGLLSWIKSLKCSLHQSFSCICKSQVLGKDQATNANSKLKEANSQLLEQACPQDLGIKPVQRSFLHSANFFLSGLMAAPTSLAHSFRSGPP